MEIRFVPGEAIETIKWNSCVHYATNGNIFGYRWYLDAVTRDWDALVEGDYESVLPLPWRSNWLGKKQLAQPMLVRELGIFSVHVLSIARTKAFLEAIPPEFRSGSLHFNELIRGPAHDRVSWTEGANFQLLLADPYEKISDQYSAQAWTLLAEAEKRGYMTVSSVKPERLAAYFLEQGSANKVRTRQFHALQRLMYNALHRGWGFSMGVVDKNQSLVAADFFFNSHGKVVSALGSQAKRIGDSGALVLLYDNLIRSQAGRPAILDLNGNEALGELLGAQRNSFPVLNLG